jgi:hypothetical protein
MCAKNIFSCNFPSGKRQLFEKKFLGKRETLGKGEERRWSGRLVTVACGQVGPALS